MLMVSAVLGVIFNHFLPEIAIMFVLVFVLVSSIKSTYLKFRE
jgi:hypothetical protein